MNSYKDNIFKFLYVRNNITPSGFYGFKNL